MVAEFNLDSRSNYPASQSLIPGTLKSLFTAFEEACGARPLNHIHSPRSITRLMAEESLSEFVRRSGYFLLIDELLTRGESSKNPQQSKKLLSLATKLLGRIRKNSFVITPARDGLHEEFVAKVLEKADCLSQTPYCPHENFKESARELKASFNDLLNGYSQNLESNGPNFKEAINQFVKSWQEFTALSLEERLKSLCGPEN